VVLSCVTHELPDASIRAGENGATNEPFVEGALLTKEGSGEVSEGRVSNLPLAPSLVRRGFIGATNSRRAGWVLGTNGTQPVVCESHPFAPSRPRRFRGRIEGRPRNHE
jgi:hypothetical protein